MTESTIKTRTICPHDRFKKKTRSESKTESFDTGDQVSQVPEDEASEPPPNLEIVDAVKEFICSRPDEDYAPPTFDCVTITVRVDSADHLLVRVYQEICPEDIRGLDLNLLEVTSVATDGIAFEFASWLACIFKSDVASFEVIPVHCEDVCPEFNSSFTAVPEPAMEYLYTKYAILTDYEPVTSEEQTAIKDLVALEARVCELLMKNPHPNIVKYWGCYVVDGRIRALCFSKYRMTLKQRIDTGVPFDTQSCVKGIRDGILHLHSLDLIHNDINPYIMIGPTDNPVIIDFDSCKREGERLVKMGTPDWFDENSKTAVPENDFYGLRKIEEYLSLPKEKVENTN